MTLAHVPLSSYIETMSSPTATEAWTPPRAIGAQVLVVPDEAMHVSKGGIVLARPEERRTARIVGVGSWAARHYPELTLGARVLWDRDGFTSFDWDGVRIEVLNMKTHCPHCRHELGKDEVLGVQQ